MAQLTAIILAAGQGMRLGTANGDLPKPFLPAFGSTFIERAIDILLHRGIHDIVIVTGHRHEMFDDLATRYHGAVRTVFNPRYASHGTMASLVCGLSVTKNAVLILDADIIYEPRAVEGIIASEHENAIVLTSIGLQGDEFFVWRKHGQVIYLEKDRNAQTLPPDAEHIGIIRLGRPLIGDLCARIGQNHPDFALPYELCLLPHLERHRLVGIDVPNLVWTEVDTPAMLDHLRQNVIPRLAELEAVTRA